MTARSVYAVIHQDFRASAIPLAACILAVAAMVGISVKGVYGPFEIPAFIWLLAGMATGSGVFARDRRTGIAPTIHSLPVSRVSLGIVRLAFRLLLLTITILIVLLLLKQFDFMYWSSGRGWATHDVAVKKLLNVYRDTPGTIGNAMQALLIGFMTAAAFSSVVKRETTAFGAAFLTLLTALFLFAAILVLHPLWALVATALADFVWLWTALASAGTMIAVISGLKLREPEPRPALVRAIRPLGITMAVCAVLFAANPYLLIARAPSLMSEMTLAAAIPGSREILVAAQGGWSWSHSIQELGIWRIGPGGMSLLADFAPFRVIPSPDGQKMAMVGRSRHFWNYWKPVLEIRDLSGRLIRRESGDSITYHGEWSLDSRWFAYPAQIEEWESGISIVPASGDGSRIECRLNVPDSPETNLQIPGVAGWLEDGSLVAWSTRFVPDTGSLTRIVRIVPGEPEMLVWEGNLWPYRVNQEMFRAATVLVPDRNSIIVPRWSGPSSEWRPKTVTLLEISLETGAMESIAEMPMMAVGSDAGKRLMVWTDTQADTQSGEAVLFTEVSVLEIGSRTIRTIRVPHVIKDSISPDGRWLAAHGTGGKDPKIALLVIVELDTGVSRVMDRTVSRTCWLDDGGLAVVSGMQNELGIVDPATGDYQLIWARKGGDR